MPNLSLEEKTRRHLEAVASGFVEALNNREFDRDSPAWKYLAPVFKAGPLPPLIEKKIGTEDYLKHLSEMCEAYPEWKLRVVDQDTHQNYKKDFALVYTNVENHGVPPGIVWQSVGISEFQEFDGEWLVVGYKGFAGGHGRDFF